MAKNVISNTGFKLEEDKLADASPVENQAASTADTVAKIVTDFNALLTKLKAAKIMEADAT